MTSSPSVNLFGTYSPQSSYGSHDQQVVMAKYLFGYHAIAIEMPCSSTCVMYP